jgi:hypothetical protein
VGIRGSLSSGSSAKVSVDRRSLDSHLPFLFKGQFAEIGFTCYQADSITLSHPNSKLFLVLWISSELLKELLNDKAHCKLFRIQMNLINTTSIANFNWIIDALI